MLPDLIRGIGPAILRGPEGLGGGGGRRRDADKDGAKDGRGDQADIDHDPAVVARRRKIVELLDPYLKEVESVTGRKLTPEQKVWGREMPLTEMYSKRLPTAEARKWRTKFENRLERLRRQYVEMMGLNA